MDVNCVAGRNTIWLQKMLTALLFMFERVGLQMNLGKIKEVVYTHIFILGFHGEAVYKRWNKGEGGTFRERKQLRLSCDVCGAIMAASSLCHHM